MKRPGRSRAAAADCCRRGGRSVEDGDPGLRVAMKLATPMEQDEGSAFAGGRDRRCIAALMAGRPSPASSSRIVRPRPRARRGPASSAERRASLHVRAGEQAGRTAMVPAIVAGRRLSLEIGRAHV